MKPYVAAISAFLFIHLCAYYLLWASDVTIERGGMMGMVAFWALFIGICAARMAFAIVKIEESK